MSALIGFTLLAAASQVLSAAAIPDKAEDQVYSPQVLNYQLQQLGLQQVDGLALRVQPESYDTQPVQFPTAEPQVITTQSQEVTSPEQRLDARYIQQVDILQSAIQAQINGQQPVTTQTINLSEQQQQQQQDQPRNLLGIAYSSAPEASRTSFSGFGVKYSF